MFLTDGGLETTLIFHEGWDLPLFEAFTLLAGERGQAAIRAYYERYIRLAIDRGTGFVLDSPTWRANPDWAAKAGYDRHSLAAVNRDAIAIMAVLRERYETATSPMVVSGVVGPRGDGYDASTVVSPDEAEDYHSWQVQIFRNAGADCVTAYTLTNINEAVGVARAAAETDIPCVISFTLETDGRLPTGERLEEAIEAVDAATQNGPAYYMINCAHPTHFAHVLDEHAAWTKRVRGLRANSSERSHAELDNSPDLDTGNPEELGRQYRDLLRRFPHINVLGGCCGTDHRHVACIVAACAEKAAA
jgi:S-methylmethionine-dependent homocysteine/selenocysteine methylase